LTIADKLELRIAVDADLAREAERQGVDLASLLESALRRAVKAPDEARRWAERNAEAIESFNSYIDAHGPFYRPHREE
jgi:post-segregation antitoxin (ccd killing protein)